MRVTGAWQQACEGRPLALAETTVITDFCRTFAAWANDDGWAVELSRLRPVDEGLTLSADRP